MLCVQEEPGEPSFSRLCATIPILSPIGTSVPTVAAEAPLAEQVQSLLSAEVQEVVVVEADMLHIHWLLDLAQ